MYFRQLDSLRAFAVLLVIIFHWMPKEIHLWLPLGSWGVELFFVLSGFLITKILLANRLNAEASGVSQLIVFKNFLIRRAIRIFPLYYLALLIILIFDRTDLSGLKDNPAWFFGYASNFFFFKTQQFNFPMAHFWSLAVEEQFYLICPWFILFLPVRFLKLFFLCSILSGIVSRIILAELLTFNEVNISVLTPTCFDLFSIGGIFSYYVVKNKNFGTGISFINFVGMGSLIIIIFGMVTGLPFFPFIQRTLDAIVFIALIANAYQQMQGIPGWIADRKIWIYIGRISYGLYVFHLLTPWLTVIFFNIISKLKISFVDFFISEYYNQLFLKIVVDSIVLLLVASMSWHFFEKPFNNFKRFFTEKKTFRQSFESATVSQI